MSDKNKSTDEAKSRDEAQNEQGECRNRLVWDDAIIDLQNDQRHRQAQ